MITELREGARLRENNFLNTVTENWKMAVDTMKGLFSQMSASFRYLEN